MSSSAVKIAVFRLIANMITYEISIKFNCSAMAKKLIYVI
jgi:hypothetical protein